MSIAHYWENLVEGIPHHLRQQHMFKLRPFKKELTLLRKLGDIYGFSRSEIIRESFSFSKILRDFLYFLRWLFHCSVRASDPDVVEFYMRLQHLLSHPHHQNKALSAARQIANAYQALIGPIACSISSIRSMHPAEVQTEKPVPSLESGMQRHRKEEARTREKNDIQKILTSAHFLAQAEKDAASRGSVEQQIKALIAIRKEHCIRFLQKNPRKFESAQEIFQLTDEEVSSLRLEYLTTNPGESHVPRT